MRPLVLLAVCLAVACSVDQKKGKLAKAAVNDTVKVTDGIQKVYYDDGTVRAEIPVKNSKRDGLAREFFRNGKVFQEINYVNGIKEGEAKQFYEHGTLAHVTQYRGNRKHGTQVKYRSDGTLSAEVKFDNDNPCRGLVEYTLSGAKKKKYPTIVVKESNTLMQDGKFTLFLSISENLQADFFEGELDKSGCWNRYSLAPLPSTGRGKAKFEITVSQGEFVMTVINIVARVKTLQGNDCIIERKYNLSIEHP